MSHKQIGKEIGRPESTVSAFCVKHFGYTRPDIVKKQQNVAPPPVSQNGMPEEHQRQSFHFRSIAFLPSPRRTPRQITREVRRSLLHHPTFCDVWHASECDVLETLVTRIRSKMGIPNVREQKRKPL